MALLHNIKYEKLELEIKVAMFRNKRMESLIMQRMIIRHNPRSTWDVITRTKITRECYHLKMSLYPVLDPRMNMKTVQQMFASCVSGI